MLHNIAELKLGMEIVRRLVQKGSRKKIKRVKEHKQNGSESPCEVFMVQRRSECAALGSVTAHC